ncbi:MAG: alpha/beta fold hydrolase [Deltaproteobacteria bacterium]|nr:alpha/beta fold hydrolase [Deltaproteobacteria bacterium]
MATMRINNVNLHYETAGQGSTIIFLHGFTGSHQDWRYQTAAIEDRYRAIALDLRGHGQSEAPTSEAEYSIYLNCADVLGLLDGLGIDRCCLVGHSMGGFTALQFALDHPDRLWGLVLVDTSSGEWDTVPGYAELRAKLDELARTEGIEAAFEYDAANNPMRIERFKIQPEQREIARKKTLGTAVDAYIYVPRSFGKWQSVTGRLGEIKVPTIIFRGENDAGFVRPSDILKEKIGNAELIVVPGTYHNPHEENSEYFNNHLMQFLKRVAR